MQRRDPAKSMHRFYGLTVYPDLVSGWTLQREWGRIGSPGRVVIKPFASEDEAARSERREVVFQTPDRHRWSRSQSNRPCDKMPPREFPAMLSARNENSWP